jgi:hypothetical protein
VTTGIRLDEPVFADKLIASGMSPVLLAAAAALQKQERIAGALGFVVQVDSINVDRVPGAFVWHKDPPPWL